jgi:hypothetical protein
VCIAASDTESFVSSLEKRISELSLDAQSVKLQPPEAKSFPDTSDTDVAAALNERLAASAGSSGQGSEEATPQVDLNSPLTGVRRLDKCGRSVQLNRSSHLTLSCLQRIMPTTLCGYCHINSAFHLGRPPWAANRNWVYLAYGTQNKLTSFWVF